MVTGHLVALIICILSIVAYFGIGILCLMACEAINKGEPFTLREKLRVVFLWSVIDLSFPRRRR